MISKMLNSTEGLEDKIEENRIQTEMEDKIEKYKKIREPTQEIQNLKNRSSRKKTEKMKGRK